jgi:hypothetical protein
MNTIIRIVALTAIIGTSTAAIAVDKKPEVKKPAVSHEAPATPAPVATPAKPVTPVVKPAPTPVKPVPVAPTKTVR